MATETQKPGILSVESASGVTTVTNIDSGVSVMIPGESQDLTQAQTNLRNYLDAVKRARMLEKTLEGEFTTGKNESELAKLASMEENKAKMNLHLGIIYSEPGELTLLRAPLARILTGCRELLGEENYNRVLDARRNVPKLSEEFLVSFGKATVSVEMSRSSEVVEIIDAAVVENLVATG